METTRQTILNILRRRAATVDELSKELGLAPATVRRHLDILSRDGHVDVTQVRRRTGRPHYVFSLSESGEELFPKHYVRTTNRLIEEIVALGPEETAGRSGRELADLVFERMSQRLAQRIAPRVHGSNVRERLQAAADALAEEGVVFDITERDGDYVLVGRGCPCPKTAEGHGHVCAHDQRLLSLVLGADVSCVEPESVGEKGSCAYVVSTEGTAGAQARDPALPGSERLV